MRATSANQTSMPAASRSLSGVISSRRAGKLFNILECPFRLRMMARASRKFAIPYGAQFPAQGLLGDVAQTDWRTPHDDRTEDHPRQGWTLRARQAARQCQ